MRHLFYFAILCSFCSCATIIKGGKDTKISFIPNIMPNRVVLKNERNNQEIEIPIHDTVIVQVSSKFKFFKRSKFEVSFYRSGFPPVKHKLTPKVTFWYWLNIPLGGVWMISVDPITGAMYQYQQTIFTVTF